MILRKNRFKILVILAVASLLAAGCAGQEKEDPCEGVTCTGHGTPMVEGAECVCQCDQGYNHKEVGGSVDKTSCVGEEGPCANQSCPAEDGNSHGECKVESDEAYCECAAGYMQDPQDSLKCIKETCREVGVTCTDSTQCCENFCLKYIGAQEGYCTRRDCTDHDGCVDKSGDGNEMCCVDFGGENWICAKLGLGCTCGDQTGQCGDSCYCTSFSGCAPDYACLGAGPEDTGAQCTKPCVTTADCQECDDGEGTPFTCQQIFGGETYCLAAETNLCEQSSTCPGDEVCVPEPNDEQTAIVGTCGRYGGKDPGDVCNDDDNPNDLQFEDRCADFYCVRGHCSEVCQLGTDCPEQMVCGVLSFCMDQGCNEISDIGMCAWMDGSLDPCDGNSDCPAHETCAYYITPDDELNKLCVTENCDIGGACAEPGDDCGEGMDPCWGDLCLTAGADGFCSALCEDDNDCPQGLVCGGLRVTEDMLTGACVEDDSCSSGADCIGDDRCVAMGNADSTAMVGVCYHTTGELDIGDECDSMANPDSVPPAEKCLSWYCIRDHCSQVCELDVDCPANMVCGQINFCMDDPCTTTGPIGMCWWLEGSLTPCSGNPDCPANEICTFWIGPDDSIHKACVAENCDVNGAGCDAPGTEGCNEDGANPCWGDLCLFSTGGGDDSWCSAACDIHSDCPDGMICGLLGVSDTQATGACLPFDGSGDSCTSDADCAGASEVCTYASSPEGGIEGICMTPVAGGGPGDDCSAADCRNDLCLSGGGESYCSAVCATNIDCPTGMECGWVGFGEEDFAPSCLKERADVSPLCSICDSSAECSGDAACIESLAYAGEKYCGLPCPVGTECDEIDGTTCADVGSGVNQCQPTDDTCNPANF